MTLPGWQLQRTTIIGARPSMDKTALVMRSAIHGAEMGHPGLIFTLEMAERDRHANDFKLWPGRWPRYENRLFAGHWVVKITKAVQRLAGLPIHIDDDSTQTIDAICSKARRWKRDPRCFSETQRRLRRTRLCNSSTRGLRAKTQTASKSHVCHAATQGAGKG